MGIGPKREIPSVRRLGLLLLLTLLLAACNGGTVDLHALKNDSEAIDSLSCEGALLANQVAHDATTSAFTQIHAGELALRASNFEDALSHRPTTPGIEKAVRTEAAKAGKVAGLLGELESDPTDSQRAVELKGQLEREGGCP
jgi:hypothetical protein